MDNDILEYAKRYILIQISYVENDLGLGIYDDKTMRILKENKNKWKSELERIESLIK